MPHLLAPHIEALLREAYVQAGVQHLGLRYYPLAVTHHLGVSDDLSPRMNAYMLGRVSDRAVVQPTFSRRASRYRYMREWEAIASMFETDFGPHPAAAAPPPAARAAAADRVEGMGLEAAADMAIAPSDGDEWRRTSALRIVKYYGGAPDGDEGAAITNLSYGRARYGGRASDTGRLICAQPHTSHPAPSPLPQV